MNNVADIIKSHNKKILREEKMNENRCNCRKKADCLLRGQCLATDVVYQAKVSEPDKDPKIYIGTICLRTTSLMIASVREFE